MGIDIRAEQLHPLRAVPDLPRLPPRRASRKLYITTFIRLCKHGLWGVRLEAVRVGGTLCTSVEALQRFFDSLAAPSSAASRPPSVDLGRADAIEQPPDARGVHPTGSAASRRRRT